ARREHVVSEESLYMELLAAEHSEEEPDAGAQEGSEDDYEGYSRWQYRRRESANCRFGHFLRNYGSNTACNLT
ncbi:hypothetical protein B0H13DRAFT_1588485, partial [Mycena leptocephala]